MQKEDKIKELNRLGAYGIVKMKGDCLTLHPSRFNQMKARYYQPWKLVRTPLVGYVNADGVYWLIAKEGEDFIRVPFAKNEAWFHALTSDQDWLFIRALPQVYITGVG